MSTYTQVGTTCDGYPIFEVTGIHKLVVLRREGAEYRLVGVEPVAKPETLEAPEPEVPVSDPILQRLDAFGKEHGLDVNAGYTFPSHGGMQYFFGFLGTSLEDGRGVYLGFGLTKDEAKRDYALLICNRVLLKRYGQRYEPERIQVPNFALNTDGMPAQAPTLDDVSVAEVLRRLDAFARRENLVLTFRPFVYGGHDLAASFESIKTTTYKYIRGRGVSEDAAKLALACRITGETVLIVSGVGSATHRSVRVPDLFAPNTTPTSTPTPNPVLERLEAFRKKDQCHGNPGTLGSWIQLLLQALRSMWRWYRAHWSWRHPR